jgi:hypothetical protein
MGIKEMTQLEKSDEMMATRSSTLSLLASETSCAVVVDLLTRLFSIWAEIEILEQMHMEGLLNAVKRYVDRLFAYFEVVGICVDWSSPKAKRVEQANRSRKSHALPLGATERKRYEEHDELFELIRMRASRDVYRDIRTRIVTYLMTEYKPPEHAVGHKLFVMGHPDSPETVQVIDGFDGVTRYSYPCPPTMEGDGQVVWLADTLDMPTVVVSNDRDTEVMLRMRWLLHPESRTQKILHMRCNERLTTFLNPKYSRYMPSLVEPPPSVPSNDGTAIMQVLGFGTSVVTVDSEPGSKRQRERDPDPSSKRAKVTGGKKRQCIYETPFADIGAQMESVFGHPREFLHATWLAFMFGCDFVHKFNWVKGVTADYAWKRMAPSDMNFVSIRGDGPFQVEINPSQLKSFLENVFDAKARMSKRPTEREYAGTIRRTLWTMIYMANQSFYPLDVPDPLETYEEGVSVWGWRETGGRVRETDVVSDALPEGSLGVQ